VSSYLFAWLLFLGLALGGMANLMLHNLTGGNWGLPVRPAFAAAARLVPLAALLGIPILFAMRSLYPIADTGWFAPHAFVLRSVAYLVIWSVLFVERVLKVDDPVGAVSVHGVCGAFGCLCIGLFADGKYGAGWNGVADKTPLGLFYGGGFEQLTAQAIGVAANVLWVFPVAFLCFLIVEKTIGNRVSARDEIQGLDIPEMGILGYIAEDPIIVQNAGQEHLTTHGPGVPRKNGGGPTVSTPEKSVPVSHS